MSETSKKYLIALDLDGTLLRDDKTISEETKEYLRFLENKGHKVVLTSGRAYHSVKTFYDEIGLKTSPIVSYNGHYATSPSHEFEDIILALNRDKIYEIYRKTQQFYKNIFIETLNYACIEYEEEWHKEFYKHYANNPIIYGDVFKNLDCDPLVIYFQLNDYGEYQDEINEIMKDDEHYEIRHRTDGPMCEIYKDDQNKGTIIKKVADALNIPYDNVIVFGDTVNDLDMLKAFKNSFLMKNGNQTIKNYASHITERTNNEDGVIFEIKKIIKNA